MKHSIQWFANNPVAANLFMFTVFILGFIALPEIRKELIPNVSLERIGINIALPGATVETVEASVCKPVENKIYDIEGTLELTSIAYESLCAITVDVADNYSTKDILSEVKNRLEDDEILPDEAESPIIKELVVRNRVAKLILSGSADYPSMIEMARSIRRELLENEEISIIDLEDIKASEIQIFIPSHNLEQYQLSFSDISRLIQQQSNQLPGGMLKTQEGDVLITANGKKDTADGYRNIIIASDHHGAEIRLEDIAEIVDSRMSHINQATFDSQQAVSMDIYRVGNQNIISLANVVNRYISQKSLPDNMSLYVWQDESKNFKSRIDLLLDNAFSGLILLFIILLLFLNFRLSFWVSLGIPFSFFGSLLLMPMLDVSLNIVSIFSFILVLGIVVDDAVIVGESIHNQNQLGKLGTEGALAGVYEVYKPLIFSVTTTIIAFLPLLFLPGPEGKLMQAIPIIVISILIFSLLESIYILPSHLSAYQKNKPEMTRSLSLFNQVQKTFTEQLTKLNNNIYQPLLVSALKNKELVIVSFSLLFIIFILLLSTGWMRVALGVTIDGEVVTCSLEFPEGSPRQKTEAALADILTATHKLALDIADQDAQVIRHAYSVIGPKIKISNQNNDQNLDHTAQITLELSDSKNRKISGQEILNRWRELIGEIDGATKLRFSASLSPTKPDINIEFSGYDQNQLEGAAKQLKHKLRAYEGTYDVSDSLNNIKRQAQITLKHNAIALGLSLENVLIQVNRAYHGDIVQGIQTRDDEVKVWLGLPEKERASLWYLEHLPILISTGQYVSLSTIADIAYRQAPNNIHRYERKRVLTVSAYVNTAQNSVYNIQNDLKQHYLNKLVTGYSDVKWRTAGKQKSIASFIDILLKGYLIAILGMYLMMAILFSSYSQPLLVLFAIPFGILGSLIGHILLDLELTLWSFIGMVAVSGIVVNDNLILMDYINIKRKKGTAIFTAVCEAGKQRFRPILLTSLTTFAGLTPLILETSIQAKFLVPMAVSLAFGVIFATFISLLLVPSTYLLLDQWKKSFTRLNAPNAANMITTETVESAYQRGFEQGSTAKRKLSSPYSDDVLSSSWEAGWSDSKNIANTI
ncbi:MAG: multidrug efflux pump subunit AcrB/ribosome modulation factor [Oleiphilaceae bacterium]|jgi:multidrug efflux pump subunit AcrB/ribosome modulation factor